MGIIENTRIQYVEENKGKYDGKGTIKTSTPQSAVQQNKNLKKVNKSTKLLTFTKVWQGIYKDIFTFKPEVSPQSSKIVESLGTDFMSRQQQHIEKQKRNLEKAAILHGRASPENKIRRADKQNLKTTSTNHANMTDIQVEETSESEVPGDANQNCLTSSLDPLTDLHTPHPPENTNPKCTSDPQDSKDPDGDENNTQWNVASVSLRPSRSKTVAGPNWAGRRPTLNWKSPTQIQVLNATLIANQEKVKTAKLSAEAAIKYKKIFTIQGPYPAIRECLRKRGWVEKFYKLHMSPPKKSPRVKKLKQAEDDDDNGDDDDDDDDDADDQNDDVEEGKIPPWDEDNGIYGIMSRVVRNSPPTFIWCVRRDAVDVKALKKDQYINHYGKATFTTKVGLCMNLRNTMWFEPVNPDSFFPRCYRLSHDEEKQAFVDDYKMTVCTSVLKWVRDHCADYPATEEELNSSKASSSPRKDNTSENKQQTSPEKVLKRKKKGAPVPMKLLEVAIEQCRKYIRFQDHADLDDLAETELLLTANWEQIFQWYYALVHDGGVIVGAQSKLPEINNCLDLLKPLLPQLDLDGYKNIWIVKPGAKSRGRGITLYNRLDEMLKLVNSSVVKKDSKFVVQKYIEQPLLVHNTKFDIRQWFLVTDWNPLTLWFYKDCYLRFCSQQYTLEMLDESIHLSNNSIQKYYSNGVRSSDLPDDNMWSSDQFKSYLRKHGREKKWDEVIYPNMKEAVICSILATQDIVEYRKSAFELYGADFMLTEDLKPWLIEINSSPCMAYTTKVTAELCAAVLEDTVKVVLDRKADKNADIGRFELAYKQTPVAVPPYIGINLSIDGQTIKKPHWASPKKEESSPTRHPTIRMSNKDSPTHKSLDNKGSSPNKKDSIDLSINSNAKSQNKSNPNSSGGKRSPVHNSKSHGSHTKPVNKSVTLACVPSTTVIPFNPCPPTKKKRSLAPVVPPAASDQEADSNKLSEKETTKSAIAEESNEDEVRELTNDTADLNDEPLEELHVATMKEQCTDSVNDATEECAKDPISKLCVKDQVSMKECVIDPIKEESSVKPQKIVTFPLMKMPQKGRGPPDPAKVIKSTPDTLLKDTLEQLTLHGKECYGVVEGSWAVEENDHYILKPEAIPDHDLGLSTIDYRLSSAIANSYVNPASALETIHHRVMNNSTGLKRHWQIHRGGYSRRSSLKKFATVQQQKSPVVDDPDHPVLLLHPSTLHPSRPGSSCDSRVTSPDPLSRHYRLQLHRPRSSSEMRPHSPNLVNSYATYFPNPTVSKSSQSPNSKKGSTKKCHSLHSESAVSIKPVSSPQRCQGTVNTPNNVAFPGLVSRYIRRKDSRNSVDMAIDCYKTNSKLTVINPSFL